jgi:putative OPT family oligopeptide transporter
MNHSSRLAEQATSSLDQNLPELTIKALILGVILAIILAASNAYLGLKAGTTISASIPAAVISMVVLRMFKNSNILESNIVQTAASAGEALVAGVAFIMPAFLFVGYWHDFKYWDCVLISISGGVLGVILSVPIRRVLLANPQLPFPEGMAIGHVLKASEEKGFGIKYLLNGGLVGAIVGFAQDGLQVLAGSYTKWFSINNIVVGCGVGFSPALIAAGYIVGFGVGASMLVGVLISWVGGVSVLSYLHPANLAPADFVSTVAHTDLRYIGLGAMLVGGITMIIKLFKPIVEGLRIIILDKIAAKGNNTEVPRTERDLSIKQISFVFAACLLTIFFLYRHELLANFNLPAWQSGLMLTVFIVFALVMAFVFSCLCSYFSGLVGATNNPVSAMILGVVILVSFLILLCLKHELAADPAARTSATGLAITIAAVVACALTLNTETIQDLKAGSMVGATPWKQQVMLFLGVGVAAFVIPGVMKLLFNAYGMAGVFPRPGMDPAQSLSAPQSAMMGLVVKAVFAHNLPWNFILTGGAVAIICMLANVFLQRRNMHIIVLAVGLGIYLPPDTTVPLIFGGFASYLVNRRNQKLEALGTPVSEEKNHQRRQKSLMLACGMVAGSALMGVILAIPFVIAQSTSVLAIVSGKFLPVAVILSAIIMISIVAWFYRVAAYAED